MSTRFIERFNALGQIESFPNAAGIGVVDGVPYVNVGGGAVALSPQLSSGKQYFVSPQATNASDTVNSGKSWNEPFASMSALDAILADGDTIFLKGVLKQNWIAPAKSDITVIGVANQPRQATSGGVPNGGGATWMNPGTVASPLIWVAKTAATPSQSWRFVNIYFGQAGAAANVILDRPSGDGDSSHASFYGCKFANSAAGGIGIRTGEILFLTIEGCTFFDFTGAGAIAIAANIAGGIANPPYLGWKIKHCKFENNVNHIIGALRNAEITDNDFSWKGRTITTTKQIDLTGGVNNAVMLNRFGVGHTEAGSAGMFLPQDTLNAWLNYYRTGFTALVPATA